MSKSEARHLEIAEFLIEQIKDGVYKPGDKIPSENTLCKQFATNHHVVRLAIARLMNLGWVTSYQGRGSFVNDRPEAFPYLLSPRTSFSEYMDQQGLVHRGQLLEWTERSPFPLERRYLNLEDGEPVYDLRIIRYTNEKPVSLSTTVIRVSDVRGLPAYLEPFESLYKILADRYSIRPIRAKSIVQAVMPGLRDASLLDMPENIPLVKIESFAGHPDGHPFEYTISKIRSDMCRYIIEF